jgi:hypothetical protein
MSSAITNFTESVSSFLTVSVLTPIISWLKEEKGVDVTLDELNGLLTIPKINNRPIPSFGSNITPPSFPPHFTGNVVSQPKKKSSKEETNNPDAPRCKYVYKRGANKGQTCSKLAVDGTDFCKDCSKKDGVKNGPDSAKAAEVKPVAPVKKPSISGFTAPLSKKFDKSLTTLKKTDKPDVFEEIESHILVRRIKENDKDVLIACGVLELDGEIRQLNDTDRETARKKNIVYENNNENTTSTPVTKQLPPPVQKTTIPKANIPIIPSIDDEDDE